MSHWRADLDTQALATGAHLDIFSDHRVVRVVTADEISIETPAGKRLNALVLHRTSTKLTLSPFDGPSISLSMTEDDSLVTTAAGKGYSRQLWVVN